MKLRIRDCGRESSQVTTPNKWAVIELKSAKVSQAQKFGVDSGFQFTYHHSTMPSRYPGKSVMYGQCGTWAPCRHGG